LRRIPPPKAASERTWIDALHENLSSSVKPQSGHTSGVRRTVSQVARGLPYGQAPRHRITPSVRAAGTGNRFRLSTDPKRRFCEWVRTPRCFRRDTRCPSYHPRARQRASDCQPKRGESHAKTLRPRARSGRTTRLLLAARSQAWGFKSLACHAPGPTQLGRPPEPFPG